MNDQFINALYADLIDFLDRKSHNAQLGAISEIFSELNFTHLRDNPDEIIFYEFPRGITKIKKRYELCYNNKR